MIEIKELVIKAVIDTSDKSRNTPKKYDKSSKPITKDVEDTINEVLDILKEKNER